MCEPPSNRYSLCWKIRGHFGGHKLRTYNKIDYVEAMSRVYATFLWIKKVFFSAGCVIIFRCAAPADVMLWPYRQWIFWPITWLVTFLLVSLYLELYIGICFEFVCCCCWSFDCFYAAYFLVMMKLYLWLNAISPHTVLPEWYADVLLLAEVKIKRKCCDEAPNNWAQSICVCIYILLFLRNRCGEVRILWVSPSRGTTKHFFGTPCKPYKPYVYLGMHKYNNNSKGAGKTFGSCMRNSSWPNIEFIYLVVAQLYAPSLFAMIREQRKSSIERNAFA